VSSAEHRYLAAKKRLDDRALNRRVLAELRRLLPSTAPRVLEVGAGLGTMVVRMLEWQLIDAGEYTLVDVDGGLLDNSRWWLGNWAAARALPSEPLPDGLRIGDLRVRLVKAELGSYLGAGHGPPADLLVAHAFLDLVDVPTVLPGLLRLLVPGGAYWFTINFDGETLFQPEHPLDEPLMRAYHRTMDERVRYGRRAGESRTGSRLLQHLRAAGAPPLAAGPSDWLVHPGPDGAYPDQDGHVVGYILDTIEAALKDQVEAADLAKWTAVRRRQLATGELCFIARQLDFAGRSPA
jgi:hypothetical protein